MWLKDNGLFILDEGWLYFEYKGRSVPRYREREERGEREVKRNVGKVGIHNTNAAFNIYFQVNFAILFVCHKIMAWKRI